MSINDVNTKNFTLNTSQVKKWFENSTNMPLLLSFLLYNFGKLHKSRPLTCSLSPFDITMDHKAHDNSESNLLRGIEYHNYEHYRHFKQGFITIFIKVNFT